MYLDTADAERHTEIFQKCFNSVCLTLAIKKVRVSGIYLTNFNSKMSMFNSELVTSYTVKTEK